MSTPTPDYGEPWRKRKTWFSCPFADREGQVVETEQSRNLKRILACINALAGVQDPDAHLARLNATIEQQAETLKVMNDALKEAHRIFGNLSHSQVVQRLCPDFAEVAELVGKSHDQHA